MRLNDKRVVWRYDFAMNRKNEEIQRIVICEIMDKDDTCIGAGFSTCSQKDQFCKEKGRKIAMGRALKAAYPTERDRRRNFWEKYRLMGKNPKWESTYKKEIEKNVELLTSKN